MLWVVELQGRILGSLRDLGVVMLMLDWPFCAFPHLEMFTQFAGAFCSTDKCNSDSKYTRNEQEVVAVPVPIWSLNVLFQSSICSQFIVLAVCILWSVLIIEFGS